MKKIQLTLCVFLLTCLVALSASAQVKLTGTVTDAAGKPLPSITVQLRGSNTGTSTNADGVYTLNRAIAPGRYVIVFSGVGFKPQEKPVTIGSSESYTVDAQLESSALSLDEVVVTGTSAGTTRRQLGSYISTVKADELSKG